MRDKSIIKPGTYVLRLEKEHENKELRGIFVAKKGEKIVVTTDIFLLAPGTKGKVHVKGVVYDGGHLEFRGIVKIGKQGVGADGYLKQEILKLGQRAVAIAIPDLEIETNEVKASHAASVGGVDAEQLAYLRMRGYSRKQAEKEIVYAFLKV